MLDIYIKLSKPLNSFRIVLHSIIMLRRFLLSLHWCYCNIAKRQIYSDNDDTSQTAYKRIIQRVTQIGIFIDTQYNNHLKQSHPAEATTNKNGELINYFILRWLWRCDSRTQVPCICSHHSRTKNFPYPHLQFDTLIHGHYYTARRTESEKERNIMQAHTTNSIFVKNRREMWKCHAIH